MLISNRKEQKSSPAAFKSTFASSFAHPTPETECTSSRGTTSHIPPVPTSPPPPLPHEPPPPLPPGPPPPPSRKTTTSTVISNKSKFGLQNNGNPSTGFKLSSTQKTPVKFNFGAAKNPSTTGFMKRVPLKNSNVFGNDESESENESGNSSDNELDSEPEIITSTKEEQQTCLTKAIDYFDTLINSEKKRKIIRFVRGSDSSGILPGTIESSKSNALPLSSIISS